MLQIKNISKTYKTGELIQNALNDMSLNLRDNEFVSILGPSGSGKTTLLNIIGGLDKYDSGDMVINGISTKEYKDRDWDTYRNHAIGFVFQSYNLIPHQSILSNVEIALTIGGKSGAERRERAKKALEAVGLGDQLHKKPNQMSGGQMQRVAIARALVNDPAILLADEPTGALDTETGIQVMELLKEVAKDRLVVMVTHNPEIAEKYSTRIVKLRDGKIVNDSSPFEPEEETAEVKKSERLAGMSFRTSLALSFNNLKTKKGRTILTAFAGSIGIIGIALILALSNGVNEYIVSLQEDTMASYPVVIESSSFDMQALVDRRNNAVKEMISGEEEEAGEEREAVYADVSAIEEDVNAPRIMENDLTAFKKYLDNPSSEIHKYIGKNGIVYNYNIGFNAYSYDSDNTPVRSDASPDDSIGVLPMAISRGPSAIISAATGRADTAANFSEMLSAKDGKTSAVVKDNYDMVSGAWPSEYNEAVIVLNADNSLPAMALYQLGLISADTYNGFSKDLEAAGKLKIEYESILGRTFYIIPLSDYYIKNSDGTFAYIGDDEEKAKELIKDAIKIKISGIIRPKPASTNATISTAVAYTAKLTDYIIKHTDESEVVKAQEASPDVNVLTGMNFNATSEGDKVADAIKFISEMNISDKASMFKMLQQTEGLDLEMLSEGSAAEQPEESENTGVESGSKALENIKLPEGISFPSNMENMDETAMAEMLDGYLSQNPDENMLLGIYGQYIEGNTYDKNMEIFGKVSYDAPSSISIYTDKFEDKDNISKAIENYNATAGEDKRIAYTDFVALMTSSLKSMVNVISAVLIAFVAVSLVVSGIMIGIITHISVMERTKEIGILRALGASKKNISQVFNAETMIVGLLSGLLGIGLAVLITIPANAVIGLIVTTATLKASLPVVSAIGLVVLSIVITVIGGLIPAKNAAKKDPVIALRTE